MEMHEFKHVVLGSELHHSLPAQCVGKWSYNCPRYTLVTCLVWFCLGREEKNKLAKKNVRQFLSVERRMKF